MPEDCINRSDVFKALCDNCVCLRHCSRNSEFCDQINAIKAIPSVDVEKAIRCESCVFWQREYPSGRAELGNLVCSCCMWSDPETAFVRYTKPKDFCSMAESVEDEK